MQEAPQATDWTRKGVLPPPTSESPDEFQPEVSVCAKRISAPPLKPMWKAPHPVILTTPNAVKEAGVVSFGGGPLKTMTHRLSLDPGTLTKTESARRGK